MLKTLDQQTETDQNHLKRSQEFFSFHELPSLDETYSDSLQCLLVVGTRSEAIQLASLALALKERPIFNPVIIASGEEDGVVEDIFHWLGLDIAINLRAGTDGDNNDGNLLVADTIARLHDFCETRYRQSSPYVASEEEIRRGQYPAALIVAGKSYSSLGAAIAGSNMRIPVMHIEAGIRLRPSDRFPYERNHRLISQLACFHFAPTREAEENLIRESISQSRVLVTGSTSIDALKWAADLNQETGDQRIDSLIASSRPLILVAAHDTYNWGGNFTALETALKEVVAAMPEAAVILPAHPHPKGESDACQELGDDKNIFVGGPWSYPAFAHLLDRADLVITDSAGIGEGAPSLNTPVLVARSGAKIGARPSAGTVVVDGSSSQSISDAAVAILGDEKISQTLTGVVNPHGDGHAGQRIATALEHTYGGGQLLPCSFGDPYSRQAVLEEAGLSGIIK